MQIIPSIKLMNSLDELTAEVNLSERYISPIANHVTQGPTLTPYFIETARDIMAKNKKLSRFGLPGSLVAAYVLEVLDQYQIHFNTDDEKDLILNAFARNAKCFSSKEYSNNPYLKAVKLPEITKSDSQLEFSNANFMPYELFIYNTPIQTQSVGKYGIVNIPPIGYFDETYSYVCLLENDVPWMSITPNEVSTMEKPIKMARGKVLTLGLGLGYFAYMAAIKPNVESVTVIEKNENIIKLFSEHILPQFGTAKDKIQIINMDAIEYINTLEDGNFDFCFADLWDSASLSEMGIYMKCREALRRFKKTNTAFWISDTFLSLFQATAFVKISNEAAKTIGARQLPFNTTSSPIELYIDNLMKNVTIKTENNLKQYLSLNYFDRAIKSTDIIY